MHQILALLLLLGGLASVLAAIPQLIKLISLKHSTEFNLFSWTIWLFYQAISVAYSFNIKAYVYVVINSLWVTFYLTMVALIVKYRKSK
jgi:uncharacterized protein with PQ loop repeat